MAYNQEHGIIPRTIQREIAPSLAPIDLEEDLEIAEETGPFQSMDKLENELEELEDAMRRAAEALEFEEAAGYRDRIAQIKSKLEMVN
jgi:excinuclease ABC subunit B